MSSLPLVHALKHVHVFDIFPVDLLSHSGSSTFFYRRRFCTCRWIEFDLAVWTAPLNHDLAEFSTIWIGESLGEFAAVCEHLWVSCINGLGVDVCWKKTLKISWDCPIQERNKWYTHGSIYIYTEVSLKALSDASPVLKMFFEKTE